MCRIAEETGKRGQQQQRQGHERQERHKNLEQRIEEQKALTELRQRQTAAQAAETATARAALAETSREIEARQAALRGVRQQWQSSLLELQRRSEALKVPACLSG